MAPPKPRLVLRLGVSGHRPNQFPDEAQRLVRQKLDILFGQFRQALDALHKREAAFFDAAPAEVHIVSALAEGADRIVAEAGVAAGFVLDAVLPFDADTYEADFETPDSKAQYRALLKRSGTVLALPGERSSDNSGAANLAYETAGLMALRQCDVLITVWNGTGAAGRGGTADIIRDAMSTGRPVLRFDTQGDGPFVLRKEPHFDVHDLALRALGPVADDAAIARIVERLCAPPAPTAEGDALRNKAAKDARAMLVRFFRERERRIVFFAIAYPLMLFLLAWKTMSRQCLVLDRYAKHTEARWAGYWSALSTADDGVRKPIRKILMPRFAWTDGLADYYGQYHRSSYVTNFGLAAAAVFFAALAGFCEYKAHPGDLWAKAAWWLEVCEAIAIMIVVVSTLLGVRAGLHKRWLSYRHLSAQLRQLRTLALTGSSMWEARGHHLGTDLQAGSLWVDWYYRMTVRELGMVSVRIDDAYLAIARTVCEEELRSQIGYHADNEEPMERASRWLERISKVSFWATLATCVLEIGLGWCKMGEAWMPVLHTMSVFLPALGAAAFGVRIQGDFEGSAERSRRMTHSLDKIVKRLADRASPPSFAELSGLTENAAAVMAGEIGDWGFVYSGRPLGLPS